MLEAEWGVGRRNSVAGGFFFFFKQKTAYDIQTLAATINWLSAEWHLTRADFTLPQTAALIGYALSAALVAGLGDRWGRRPILILAAALMGTASIGTAFSANVNQLTFWPL